jgi:branched-chain amino acid transport system permease protein
MLSRLLSGDLPRNRALALFLAATVVVLLVDPFVLPGAKGLNIAAKILVFVVLVTSFDLLLGYTGVVSFAHTVFFGIGAYGIAIAMTRLGPSWPAVIIGIVGALGVSAAVSLAVGLFSLRIRAIFFSMITLALLAAFQTFASQMSEITGGEDGLTFRIPAVFLSSFRLSDGHGLLAKIDGRILCYYFLFLVASLLVIALLRVVNSPFGRVLQAIRENEFRAEAIGYRVVVFKTASTILSASCACIAGAMQALWLRYNGPDASLSLEIMLDVLLIIAIGGIGTIYGPIVGVVLFLVAEGYLQEALRAASSAFSFLPWVSELFSPDRWMLWLGLLFVISVYYFPNGIVGALRERSLVPQEGAAEAIDDQIYRGHAHESGSQNE